MDRDLTKEVKSLLSGHAGLEEEERRSRWVLPWWCLCTARLGEYTAPAGSTYGLRLFTGPLGPHIPPCRPRHTTAALRTSRHREDGPSSPPPCYEAYLRFRQRETEVSTKHGICSTSRIASSKCVTTGHAQPLSRGVEAESQRSALSRGKPENLIGGVECGLIMWSCAANAAAGGRLRGHVGVELPGVL